MARAKREIQAILQQIGALSRSDADPDRYYEEFLNKVVGALAAVGGAVWTVSDAGGLQLTYQVNLRQTGLIENPIAQAQHGRLLHRVLTGETGEVIAPHSGFSADGELVPGHADDQAPANATDFLLVLSPVYNDQGPQGLVEVFQRPGSRPQVQQGYLRFLEQACDLAGDYLRSRRLSHLANKQSLWEQLETFTRRAHEQLDIRQASYTIANDGRRLIGADRVTVATGPAGRLKIQAVSGKDTFDTRSNVTTMLTKVARAVAKTGEDVWYTGDTTDFAPQVEKTIDAYVDESNTKAMAILPLIDRRGEEDEAPEAIEARRTKPPQVIGAVIVEQMVDNRVPDGFRQRVDVVRSHSETALANAQEHEGLFLMPLWKLLGKAMWLFRGRTLPKTLGVTTLVVGLTLAALFVQKDFTLEGSGKLRPAVLRNVFAEVDGTVIAIRARHEQTVAKGAALLLLRSNELDKDLTVIAGQIEEALAEQLTLNLETGGNDLTPAERESKLAQLAKIEKQLATLRAEQRLLEEKQGALSVTSPIDGQVITWNVEELLMGRPVQRGNSLLEVADPSGDWILEVEMPEKRMGHINRALEESGGELPVEFLPATSTDITLEGTLTREGVAASAEVRGEQGTTVYLTVNFDQKKFQEAVLDPKVGAEVKAKVACGKRSIAYAYLHDLLDFIRAKVLFRLF
ncbi:MAG: HlyD family efflux transporter periplasmic adaptor subunit [Planctomycetota bacterium]